MRNILCVLLVSTCLLLWSAAGRADDGLVDVQSQFGVAETLDRFEAAAKDAGLHIFARLDHAKGATSVGQQLRPTELLIFGNPKVGTGVMSSNQQAGIELPMKVLAWEDAEGVVWLSYTRPDYLFQRFQITDRAEVEKQMSGALAKLSKAATQP
ncbi:MAG: DUF302 domain-containing protein [Chromatiales bacterium]|jgi:uncharacterized protein (DUF302 family)